MTLEQFAAIFIIFPLCVGIVYCAYRAWMSDRGFDQEIEKYIETEKEIERIKMEIMDLRIQIEVERQLKEAINKPPL